MGLAIQPTRRIGGKIATLIAVFALVMQPMYGLASHRIVNANASSASETVYDSSMNTLTGQEYGSLAINSNRIHELGDRPLLAGTARQLDTVSFNMSNWTLREDQQLPQAGVWCDNNPGKCTDTGFIYPMTAKVYSGDLSTVLGEVERDMFIPWRPAGDPSCELTSNGPSTNREYGWRVGEDCINGSGIGFIASFDFTSLGLIVPNDAVYSISFNTQVAGEHPTGVQGPIDKVNVSLNGNTASATIGQDYSTDHMYADYNYGSFVALQWGSAFNLGLRVTATHPVAPAGLKSESRENKDITNSATSTNFVRNSWTRVDGATSYNYEFRKPNNLPTFSRKNIPATTTFIQGQFHDSNGPEGQYAFRVQAVYPGGTVSQWSEWSNVAYDKTSPAAPKNLAVRVTSNGAYVPNNGYTNQQNVTASWENGANEEVTYIYNYWKTEGSTWSENNKWPHATSQTSYAGSYNQDEGVHKFCVIAVDRAGNQSDCSATYTVTYDITAPTAAILAPANGSAARGVIEITGKMTDETQVGNHWFEITGDNYSFNTGAGVDNGTDSWTYSWDTTGLADGTYTIRYVAKDKAGNRSDVNGSTIHTVTVDNTAPGITITNDGVRYTDTNSPRIITGTVDSDATQVQVSIDGGEWVAANYTANESTWSYQIPRSLANGTYTVLARAVDGLGNVGSTESGTLATAGFTIAVPAPDVFIPVVVTPTDPDESPDTPPVSAQNTVLFNALGLSGLANQGNAVIGSETDASDNGDVAGAVDMRGENGDVLSAQDDRDQWSIINLLLAIVVTALSVIALFGLAGKNKENRSTLSRLLTIVPVLGAGAVLLFAEDFSGQMGWVNIWTLLVGALVVVQMILLANTRSQDEK